MIGNLLEHLSWNTVYGTQHCPHKCHRRAVPLCAMQPMESNHLEITCPLKNQYTLLWDMPDNTGYINVVAVMQKFFDQAISGNWSYNPEHYPDNEVPTTVMAQDFLTTYKYGWKTSYYQNTNDMKTDDIEEPNKLDSLLEELSTADEEE